MYDPDEFVNLNEGEYEEYDTYFVDCTCLHSKDQHGWGYCEVEGCTCKGGWEE